MHRLQRGQDICGIPPEARQFEDQYKGDIILAGLNVFHHAVKLVAAFYGLSGLAGILILPRNLIVIEFRKGAHAGPLGIQGIAIDLHCGRYAGINIDLDFLIFHQRLLKSLDILSTCILPYICPFFNKKEGRLHGNIHRIGLIVMQPVSLLH